MKTYTTLERDAPADPLAAIRAARTANDLPTSHSLIQAEAKRNGGQISGALGYQYALTLMAGKQYGEAMDVLALFSSQHPDTASSWFLLGQCSEILGHYGFAEASFRESVRAHKRKRGQADLARSYFSLGSNLFRLGRPLEGEDAWRKGLRGECTTPEALFVRSQVLLAFGDYKSGWADYESRRTLPGWAESVSAFVGDRKLPPEWDGKARGRVFVYGEQGAGDVLMFSRYWRDVAGITDYQPVIVGGAEMQPLISDDMRYLPCEWSAPIGSLPLLTESRTIPKPRTFQPDRGWSKPTTPKPRVGVCWKGSPHHMNDKDRSSPIDFRDALQDERWDIVSLQYGISGFVPKDYLETAEIMRTLDAVVSCDTSVVHVAGTLGVPTVLIPPASPEWRWGIAERKSAWYPSIEIVRRTRVDAWPEALRRAKRAISEKVL